jgi:hypothetical protein
VFFVAECREFSRFSFLLCHESKHELICLWQVWKRNNVLFPFWG